MKIWAIILMAITCYYPLRAVKNSNVNNQPMITKGMVRSSDRLPVVRDSSEVIARLTSSLLSEEIEEDSSVRGILKEIFNRYLEGCNLILLIDKRLQDSVILQELFHLPNAKQIVSLTTSEEELKRVLWKSNKCQGVLIVWDPYLLIEFGYKRPLDWDYSARIIIVGISKEDLYSFIQTKKAKKTQQIIGLVKNENIGTFEVYMNEHFWGQRGIKRIATWQSSSFTRNVNMFPDKISNLQQTVLDLFVFEWEPAVIYRRNKDNKLLERYGRDMEVVASLCKTLNFTVKPVEPAPNELFGIPINNTYNGLIGALHNEKVDIAAVNLWITTERMPFMGYSQPFSVDQACILARVEPPLPLWQSPGLPFQVDTWIAILIGLICAGPVLHMIAQGSKKSYEEESSHFSLNTSSLYVFGAHFCHPLAYLPLRSSSRIFIAFLWIYSILLTTSYKSNLTAFLTVTREPKSMQTMKELHESGRKVLGLNYYRLEFLLSEFAHVRALARNYEIRLRFDATKEDVLKGHAVTMNSKVYLEFYVDKTAASNGRPFFRVMRECLPQHSVAIGYQTNSPLKPKFDQVIMHMFESGLSRRWFLESIRKYKQLRKQDEDPSLTPDDKVEDRVIVLSLDHMQGVFILWCFGAAFATILFGIESISS